MRRVGLVMGVAALAAAVSLHAGETPAAKVRVQVRDASGERSLDAEVIVEAADGGLLLELPDQRLEVVDPAGIVAREPIDRVDAAQSPRDLGRRIIAELPSGFDQVATKHYLLCFDTSRAYAQWCGALFERLHDAFQNFWEQAGFDVEEPGRPLVVVIFSDRERYESFAARDLGAAADRVVGYYNLMSNRVTTFDLTGSDTLAGGTRRTAGKAGLEILARPEASGLVATLVHEATHQMAFNCGMHRRLAAVPLWVSEGVATYFETPDLGSGRGWRGVGGVNRPRLEKFLAAQKPGMLEPMVLGDEPFRRADEALDAYARAWALTYFLLQTKRESFIDYLRTLSRKEPLVEDSPETRRQDFIDAFGGPPAAFEEPLAKFMARVR
jgi:hypothetical protein